MRKGSGKLTQVHLLDGRKAYFITVRENTAKLSGGHKASLHLSWRRIRQYVEVIYDIKKI